MVDIGEERKDGNELKVTMAEVMKIQKKLGDDSKDPKSLLSRFQKKMKAKEEEMAALQTTLSFLETHEEEVAALEEDRNDAFTQFIITPNERNTELEVEMRKRLISLPVTTGLEIQLPSYRVWEVQTECMQSNNVEVPGLEGKMTAAIDVACSSVEEQKQRCLDLEQALQDEKTKNEELAEANDFLADDLISSSARCARLKNKLNQRDFDMELMVVRETYNKTLESQVNEYKKKIAELEATNLRLQELVGERDGLVLD